MVTAQRLPNAAFAILDGQVDFVNTHLETMTVGVVTLVVLTVEIVISLLVFVIVLLVIMESIVKYLALLDRFVLKECVKMEEYVLAIQSTVYVPQDGQGTIAQLLALIGVVKAHIVIAVIMDIVTLQQVIVCALPTNKIHIVNENLVKY